VDVDTQRVIVVVVDDDRMKSTERVIVDMVDEGRPSEWLLTW